MKLIEAVKTLKGNPVEVLDCPRNTLPLFFKEMGFKTGAEIGVYKAEFSEFFCKAGLKMNLIDPWMAYQGAGRTQKEQDRQDFLFGHATRALAPYKDCAIIRKTSVDALSDFEDGSQDFVYIDGDHEFGHVATDIAEWAKKVRVGGVVSGHDYFVTDPRATNLICQVKVIVDAYVKAFGIDNWYIFGRLDDPQSKNDRYNSWMWIKQ